MQHLTSTRTIGLIAGLAIGVTGTLTPAAHAQDEGDPLPIRSITLYRSGVGAFERSGTVAGDADVHLRFDAEQMNDILKSLVVLDLDGGAVASVGYGSKEPLARRLASFAVDISDNPSMAGLLGRLRGAPVHIDRGSLGGPVEGTIVGVESRETPTEAGSITEPFVTLLTPTGMRSVAVSRIEGFEILDERLAEELRLALEALAEHRTDTTKTVDLELRGSGQRRVVAAYVHEAPVWKTSYRLVLDDDDDAIVQGWAIVENTTDEDWSDVRLSLVAGRPVSFVMDLYQPLFLPRPLVGVPVMAGVGPRVYDDGRAIAGRGSGGAQRPYPSVSAEPNAPRERASMARSLRYSGEAEADAMDDMASGAFSFGSELSSATAAANAAEVGEQFFYELSAPVTIERRRSAMLPILTGDVSTRRVSIYDATNPSGEHPMRGVEIENTSGLQLMPGPISVYDADAYAGDAQIGHVSAGDERLLSYAVDLDVTIDRESEGANRVSMVSIVEGVIRERVEERLVTTYAATNNNQQDARTIIVEHPKRSGYEFAGDTRPTETTPSAERFEFFVAAGGEGSIEIDERRTVYRSIAIANYDIDRLAAYVRGGQASSAVLDAMKRAAELQREVASAKAQLSSLEQARAEIFRDQSRIRDNLSRLDRNSDYAKRLITKLDAQESELETLAEQADETGQRVQRAEQALADYVNGLSVK